MMALEMVRLLCEKRERYLRFIQANRRKEVGCAQVIQIDSGALDGTGMVMNPALFDIKILHQGYSGKEQLAGVFSLK